MSQCHVRKRNKGKSPPIPTPCSNRVRTRADERTPLLCLLSSPISPSTPGLGMLMQVRVSVSSLFLVSPFFPMTYLEAQKCERVTHVVVLGRSLSSVSSQQTDHATEEPGSQLAPGSSVPPASVSLCQRDARTGHLHGQGPQATPGTPGACDQPRTMGQC